MKVFKYYCTSLIMLRTGRPCGVLGFTTSLILISKKPQSKYIYTLSSDLCAPVAREAIKQFLFRCLIDTGVAYKPYKTPPVNYFLAHLLNPIHYLVLQMGTFYQQRHVSLDNAK